VAIIGPQKTACYCLHAAARALLARAPGRTRRAFRHAPQIL